MTANGTSTTEAKPATHLSEQQGFWAGVGVLLMAVAVLVLLGPTVDPDAQYHHLIETLLGTLVALCALGAGLAFRRAADLAEAGWATFFTTVAWIAYGAIVIVVISTCNSWSPQEPMVPWPLEFWEG